ncbi:autophagy-related protein 16 [Ananas comosus]|uniref:Autophagy-related protein 16 n=1 Tax=Ananas comosus TaxID=4615 RepID=A0A6P5GN57_ANACO|nr:autophagy-related protein 16 [Ananas comosus]
MTTRDEIEIGRAAIRRAIRALRKRHLLEEGAHAPAINALTQPFTVLGLEWKEKAENLELELQQCYKAQSRLSEQLVVEVAESRSSKALLQEKDALLANLKDEVEQTREENSKLKESLDEKTKALDLLVDEHRSLRAQFEEVIVKLKDAEAENKKLIDRWMLEKMQDAERLNEANAMYEEMLQKLKLSGAGGIQQQARQESDGIIRRTEAGYFELPEPAIPSVHKLTLQAHEGGCGSITFQHKSDKLISGGQDRTVKIWDSQTGALNSTLQGSLGSVLDLTVTNDNKCIIAACSTNNLYVWQANGGRIRHTLTGHVNKVCSVDANRVSSSVIASASLDHTIKIWDLNTGYCSNTIMSSSNCNTLSFIDHDTICSGHVDGNIRIWDIRRGKCSSQVAAHPQVTSVCVSRSGNLVLTSGKDNVHNLFDVRTLEVCGTFRAGGSRVVSNWGRSCISADENCIVAGASDGSVYVWSRLKGEILSILEGHSSAVLSCAWSELGQPLASADRSGNVFVWN